MTGLINYDNPPGGLRPTNGDLADQLAMNTCVTITKRAYDVHCFIPTVSALDVKGGASNPYQPVPQQGADTPFDNYLVSDTNELHVTMTAQAATFLLDELLGQLNVALDKPSTVTSSADGFGPALGNDGLVATGWQPADGDTQPAWTVDLGRGYQLTEIRLTTRQDLDQPVTRRNFQIWASNDPSMNDHVVLGGQGSDALPFQAVWKLAVTDQAAYRYIRAVKTAAEGFFVAELEVAITAPATLPLHMVMPGTDLLPYVTASRDGFNWELALGPVIAGQLGSAPDLAAFAGNLVMTCPATDGTVSIYTSADGIDWAPGTSLGQAAGPARMTTMDGQLFISFWRADGRLYVVSTADLRQWYWYPVNPKPAVPSFTVGSAPTITALNGILYLGVRSVSNNVYILASADQARTWKNPGSLDILVGDSPAVCGLAGDLYIACWDNADHTASVWRTSDQGNTAICVTIGWPARTWIASGTPTLTVMNDTLFLGFPGNNTYEFVLVYDGDKGWTVAANQAGGRQIGLPAALTSFTP